jgi:hypothetical protein
MKLSSLFEAAVADQDLLAAAQAVITAMSPDRYNQIDKPEVSGHGSVQAGVRDWGQWTHDQGNEDEEDDDHEVLTPAFKTKLKAIEAKVQAKYPKLNVMVSTG